MSPAIIVKSILMFNRFNNIIWFSEFAVLQVLWRPWSACIFIFSKFLSFNVCIIAYEGTFLQDVAHVLIRYFVDSGAFSQHFRQGKWGRR